jgi:hypothetical protein
MKFMNSKNAEKSKVNQYYKKNKQAKGVPGK